VRFPEAKIKEAILGPELGLRCRAITYFTRSFSTDPEVMPLVIQAVETYANEEPWHMLDLARELVQTDETLAWAFHFLNVLDRSQHGDLIPSLNQILVHADPALLAPHEQVILKSPNFSPELHAQFKNQLQMLSWDEATCWQVLHALSGKEDSKDEECTSVVEALARFGDRCQEKVEAILAAPVEDSDESGYRLQLLAVELAGRAGLQSAVPLILARLADDSSDFLNEQCVHALTRIGTPATVEAIGQAYPTASEHVRRYVSHPLSHIHCELAVTKILEVLPVDQKSDCHTYLASALLSQFATEGIEESRKLLTAPEPSSFNHGLYVQLIETTTIMGETFPEYDQWRAELKAEKAEERHLAEVWRQEMANFAAEYQKASMPRQPARPARLPAPSAPKPIVAKAKAGRNDRCPCGSGKKFKACCMLK